MINLHGIINAFHSYSTLNELVALRTNASLPFCSRYRIIDFALSSMTNAGIRDVGVIMNKNYQSLLDHIEGGKEWDLSRSNGGLSLLPPYGFYDSERGEYRGLMEALGATRSYSEDIKQDHVCLFRSDLIANIDLKAVYDQHIATGADITAVCVEKSHDPDPNNVYFSLPEGEKYFSNHMYFRNPGSKPGMNSLEIYIIKKDIMSDMIEWAMSNSKLHFHKDAMAHYLNKGGKVGIYVHKGYTKRICSVGDFYDANLDMLDSDIRAELFPEDRPVYTKGRSSVSTYYTENAKVKNSLVADGCHIEGEVENSVIFRNVKIKKGAKIRDCVIFQGTVVGENADLTCVICDKGVICNPNVILAGNHRLPITVPKGQVLTAEERYL